jgi:Holliday junction resolvasome RuvABC endonuclease subunit
MIAGFDPSMTHFGWVLLNEIKEGKDALLDFGIFKTEPSDGLIVQRLITQRERILKFLQDNKITFVAMEAPIWQDFSTEILWALNQFLHEVFLNLGIFVMYIQPMSLKKFACPNINTLEITKHHIVHQAKTELDKHGRRFAEHIADAYFVGKIGAYFYRWYFLKLLKDNQLPEYLQGLFCGKHEFVKGIKKGTTEYHGIIYKENEQFFDYTKHKRKTASIKKEVNNGLTISNQCPGILSKTQ